MAVHPIPAGYHTATPYLIVRDGRKAIDFYRQAFGARELARFEDPATGTIGHAEIRIGDSVVMLADATSDHEWKSPMDLGGTPVGLMLYVEDADRVFQQAVSAGAIVKRPMADQFYGDRSGTVVDPFGHVWTLATHQEDVSPEEMQRRFREAIHA